VLLALCIETDGAQRWPCVNGRSHTMWISLDSFVCSLRWQLISYVVFEQFLVDASRTREGCYHHSTACLCGVLPSQQYAHTSVCACCVYAYSRLERKALLTLHGHCTASAGLAIESMFLHSLRLLPTCPSTPSAALRSLKLNLATLLLRQKHGLSLWAL
jgi:hypothetical protein